MAKPFRSVLPIAVFLALATPVMAAVQIGSANVTFNGRVMQSNQYTGSCPVAVTLDWGLFSPAATKVSYTFVRSDGGHLTGTRTGAMSASRELLVTEEWQLGANIPQFQNFNGWVELRITAPNQVTNRYSFTIHCVAPGNVARPAVPSPPTEVVQQPAPPAQNIDGNDGGVPVKRHKRRPNPDPPAPPPADARMVPPAPPARRQGGPEMFVGTWQEINPASGPAMRLRITPQGPQMAIGLSYSDAFGNPFGVANQDGGLLTWTSGQGCSPRFQSPGYDYQRNSPIDYRIMLTGETLVYEQDIRWLAPCGGHPVGLQRTIKSLRRVQ